ncbi:hypothetical protein DFH07DRAFT_549689 [Mycena maculata]|uniref:Secreted protein n=1 Tax=Mycena maculata TaxID=230809 RepID=A0AAD7IT81_9AGAR|nr:hypothetical protein DFH07DRAFT_549689 [Mycena maculata]
MFINGFFPPPFVIAGLLIVRCSCEISQFAVDGACVGNSRDSCAAKGSWPKDQSVVLPAPPLGLADAIIPLRDRTIFLPRMRRLHAPDFHEFNTSSRIMQRHVYVMSALQDTFYVPPTLENDHVHCAWKSTPTNI